MTLVPPPLILPTTVAALAAPGCIASIAKANEIAAMKVTSFRMILFPPPSERAESSECSDVEHDESVIRRDRFVMTAIRRGRRVNGMSMLDPVTLLVLEEFRLHTADVDGEVARIVASSSSGIEPVIPLLTSVEDRRDVASIRGLHAGESAASDAAQRAALFPLVSSWVAPKYYEPRMAKRSTNPPSSFRLAVTDLGFNRPEDDQTSPAPRADHASATRAVGLVWIGAPISARAGLVILLGNYDDAAGAAVGQLGWSLPFSRELGVRIYETAVA